MIGGVNTFSYVGGSPSNKVDPSGLRQLSACELATLSPYFPGFDLGKIDVEEGLPWIASGNTDAMTFGNSIYVRNDAPDTARGIALLGHEITHSTQYARDGWGGFFFNYAVSYVTNRLNGMDGYQAYQNIPYEAQAFAMGDRVTADPAARSDGGSGDGGGANCGCKK